MCKCVTYSVIYIVMIIVDKQPKSLANCPLILLSYVVPTTPVLDVCAVYDMVNETLQIIESNWTEVVCKLVTCVKDLICDYYS